MIDICLAEIFDIPKLLAMRREHTCVFFMS